MSLIGHTLIIVCPHCREANYYDEKVYRKMLSEDKTDTCVKCEKEYNVSLRDEAIEECKKVVKNENND